LKIADRWSYLYRAVDQHGQVIDVLLSTRRDLAAARCFFTRALRAGTVPAEVTTDRAAAYPRVLDELIPSALHIVERYANNPVETDHGRLKARLRPMRGVKRHRSARILAAGHAFVENPRRGHYDIATHVHSSHRLRTAFDELAGRWTYLSGHRRAAVCAARPRGRPPVLHLRAALGDCLCRGHYGPGPAYPRVLDELIPSALHTVERYANNPVEADHGRLKARLRPMRDLKCHRSAHPGRRPRVRSETSAAATMNSPPTSPPATGSAQYSTS
jgi:IS6 family transposase